MKFSRGGGGWRGFNGLTTGDRTSIIIAIFKLLGQRWIIFPFQNCEIILKLYYNQIIVVNFRI